MRTKNVSIIIIIIIIIISISITKSEGQLTISGQGWINHRDLSMASTSITCRGK